MEEFNGFIPAVVIKAESKYVQGEIATLTVQFLDSKGNKANTVTSNGAVSIVMPFMTAVSATDSATNQPTKADGTRSYTFTVGGASGVTDGTYNGIIDFTNLTAVAAVKAVPNYKITSGTTDTPFAEVLKSVIALIASINKQIQVVPVFLGQGAHVLRDLPLIIEELTALYPQGLGHWCRRRNSHRRSSYRRLFCRDANCRICQRQRL